MAPTKMKETEKKEKSFAPLRYLIPYMMRYKPFITGAVISLLLAAITTLTLPVAVRRLIDHGFSKSDSTFISEYFSMLIVVVFLLALSSAFRFFFVMVLGERIVSDLREDVFSHVVRLSPTFFDSNQSGEIVSRLTADTTQIKAVVGATASVALRNVVLGFGAVIMMVVTSPKLSSLVLVAIPLVVFPLIWFGRSVRKRSRLAQDALAGATAFASEQIGAVRTMQAFTNEDHVSNRYFNAVESAFRAIRSSIGARSFLTFYAIFTIFSSVVGVLWFGSQDVLSGDLTPGAMGQFLLYSVFAAGALGALSEVWGDLSQAAGAAERLVELLHQDRVIKAPQNPTQLPTPSRGEVTLENVNFAYPLRPDLTALTDLSFTVKAGETVAIVGASGAGKSTLFSLLLRFYDPQSGDIKIDDIDIRNCDPEDVRNQIAIVPQDVNIFAASARDNIAFGKFDASDEQVKAAAQAAYADEFITNLADGYETQLGERGVTLSGGQRQRIAIARAILRDAPILLLDEATSALDAHSERLVQDALDGLMEGRTTLVIAHRLATVLKADRILVLDHGKILEEGNHASLVAKGGAYARLAKLQFHQG